MARLLRTIAYLIPVLGIAGCGDNIAAVMRDTYNVQHEILDGMTQIVDDASAKEFNEAYKNRFQGKEEVVKARKEKIENNLFSEKDRADHKAAIAKAIGEDLKGQVDSLDYRFRIMQNRLRRLIVKLVEDKAEAAKSQNQSFKVSSTDVCPNLTNLERGENFAKGGGGGGGLGGAPNMMPMMQPGGGAGPGGAGMPAMPAMNPAGGDGAKPAAAGPVVDPKANDNFVFVIECRHTGEPGNPWLETRAWKAGNTTVGPIEVNGINILPLYSAQ